MSRLAAIHEARTFEDLYALIPSPRGCTGQCAESCGPIGFSTEEGRRLRAAGADIPNIHDRHARSPVAGNGECPSPCPCPYVGCSVLDPLTYEGTSAVFQRGFELGGMPGVVDRGGVRR